MDRNFTIDESSIIEESATVGAKTQVWGYSHIRKGAQIGQSVMIGRNVFIDHDVKIGDFVRIQNNSLVYFPTKIESNVFIGPGVIITNDRNPRSRGVNETMEVSAEWNLSGIHVHKGASIGAGCVCVGPAEIGSWSLIAAGSVLIGDAVPFGLYMGIPARRKGWVGHEGYKLRPLKSDNLYECPITNKVYQQIEEEVLVTVP